MWPLAFAGHGGWTLLASVAQAAGRKEPELSWEQQGLRDATRPGVWISCRAKEVLRGGRHSPVAHKEPWRD